MEIKELHNPMRENAYDVPQLVIGQCKQIEADSRMILTTPEIYQLRKIIVVGCGDSYAAGLAMKPAMEELTGLSVEVLPAMEVARFTHPDSFGKPGSTLVMAVSSSGTVTRVAEAVAQANRHGCLTLAVTAKEDSPLALAAQKRVPLHVPAFPAGGGNGVRSYRVSMLSLLLIAIRIGEVKGRYMMTDSEDYRRAICDYAAEWEAILPQLDEQILNLTKQCANKTLFDFVGSGGNYGSAWFSHAKILEATGDYAIHTDTEAWLHLNCFFRDLKNKLTVVYVSEQGNDLGRVQELIGPMAQLPTTVWVVTDSQELPLPEQALRITVPKAKYQWLWPLMNDFPMSLMAGYLSVLKGESYGRSGQEDWKPIAGTGLLSGSKMVLI